MARHDDLLSQGPHDPPEPETAEQRSKRLGMRTAAGGVVAGTAVAAKVGALSKVFLWLFAFHALNVWRIGGWVALGLVAVAVAAFIVLRTRSEGER